PRYRRQFRALVAAAVAAATLATMVLVGIAPAVSAASAAAGKARAIYIVQMTELPLAAYNGTISGYPATRPAAGTKLQADSASAKKYRALLEKKHTAT